MSTIEGAEIKKLVSLLSRRGVKFYHACQLKDFKTYLKLEGVPSRAVMEEGSYPFTKFETDEVDRVNEVWDLVFGNLQDYGVPYAFGKWSESSSPTPNPYGPILLVFDPKIFLEADDVAVCLRSAGGMRFNRDRECISSCEEMNKIFKYEDMSEASNEYAKAYIAYTKDLIERFENKKAKSPEVSMIVDGGVISFSWILKIEVDSHIVSDKSLHSVVRKLVRMDKNVNCKVWERKYKDTTRCEILRELTGILQKTETTLLSLSKSKSISEELQDWVRRLRKGEMDIFFNRFVKYLRSGTVLELAK